jgi:hypothetical protein
LLEICTDSSKLWYLKIFTEKDHLYGGLAL